MKKNVNVIRILGCLLMILFLSTSCYPSSTSTSRTSTSTSTTSRTQKLLVVVTDSSGKVTTSRIIDGNIKNRSAIEQFAKNIANNPGYSYIGGSWNNDQFVGVVNSPAGRMLVAVRVAD